MGRSIRQLIRAVGGMRNYRALVYAVLIAFVAQGVIAQSHFHVGGAGGVGAFAHGVLGDAAPASPGKSDSKQAPRGAHTNCLLCHAASLAGAYFASAAPILRVPALSTLFVPRDERRIVVERFAVHWQSRAPPSL